MDDPIRTDGLSARVGAPPSAIGRAQAVGCAEEMPVEALPLELSIRAELSVLERFAHEHQRVYQCLHGIDPVPLQRLLDSRHTDGAAPVGAGCRWHIAYRLPHPDSHAPPPCAGDELQRSLRNGSCESCRNRRQGVMHDPHRMRVARGADQLMKAHSCLRSCADGARCS